MLRWITRLLRRGDGRGEAAASEAVRRAEAAQAVTESRTPEVSGLTRQLRHLNERNHFAEAFNALLHQRGGA